MTNPTRKWRRRLVWNVVLSALAFIGSAASWLVGFNYEAKYVGPEYDHGPQFVLEYQVAVVVVWVFLVLNGVLGLALAYHAVRSVGAFRQRRWREGGPREF